MTAPFSRRYLNSNPAAGFSSNLNSCRASWPLWGVSAVWIVAGCTATVAAVPEADPGATPAGC
jgi:hypothetical protein